MNLPNPHAKGPGPLCLLTNAEHFLKLFLLYACDARGQVKLLREEAHPEMRAIATRAARRAAASAREFYARFMAARDAA